MAQGFLGLFWLGLHLCVPWATGNACCRPHITRGVCLHTLGVAGFIGNKKNIYVGGSLPEKADFYRLVLLYNYGGCWFDLDCFFLRSFDPLFINYEKEVCLYQWEKQNYPNNAIIISLEPKCIKMEQNINKKKNNNQTN